MDIKRDLISRYKFLSKSFLLAVAISGLSSCSESEFSVSGNIQNGQNKSIVLERGENGHWISLDSVTVRDDGTFDINFISPKYADIYRLRMDDKFVYLPIDSTENLTLETTSDNFGVDYVLSGSEQAEKMAKFESEANKLSLGSADSVEQFKRKVYSDVIREGKGNILSYHVLNKTIGGSYLFDPNNPADAKYYAAVATAYKEFKPNDPRTKWLENKAVELQRMKSSKKGLVQEVETVAFFDIDLKDCNGENKKLSEVMQKGVPTIVVFSLLTHPDSPILNRELAKLKEEKGDAIGIYQVCLDEDQLDWRQAALNLPWTVVYEPDGMYSQSVLTYNVSVLPTFYVYDSNGELAASSITIEDLRKLIP